MNDQVSENPRMKPKPGLIHRISSRKGMVILAIGSLFLLLAAIGGVMYYASKRPSQPAPAASPPSLNELATEFPEISQILQDEKLASVYKEFLMAYQQGGQEAAYELARKRGIVNAKNEVRMTLELDTTDTSELVASLEEHGINVTTVSGNMIDISIPLAVIEASMASDQPGRIFMEVSGLEHIVRLRLPQVGTHDVGSVETEGVAVIGADVWQAAGITGKGVKVGVLDVGFDKYKSLLGGDLPENVLARSFIADTEIDQTGTVHGAAVAEIIHDVAPDAELIFAAYQTLAEKQVAVDWLMSQGVDMISSSTGMTFGPRDDTGPAAQMVDQVVAQGVLWVNSSGNTGTSHYRGKFTDTDGNGYHEFAPGDEYMGFSPDGTATLALNWDDWKNGTQDFDLYVMDQNGKEVVSSTDRQTGPGSDAGEFISYEFPDSGPYYLQIYAVNATRQVTFDFFLREGALEYYNPEFSVNTPGDARSSLTIGATNWQSDELEDYSSRGPTEDGRMKPEVVAPSGVNSAAFGESWNGTSASCPHVSGAAALILQAFPDYSPQQVTDFLTSRAEDIGASGPDDASGYGRIWLGDPPALSNVEPGPTPTQPAIVMLPTRSAPKNTPKPTATPKLEKEPATTEDGLDWIANLILVGCVILPGLFGLAGIGLLGVIVYRRRSQSRFTSQPYPSAPPVWPMIPPAPEKPAADADNLCPRCGTLNRPGARFCVSCGFEMQISLPPAADNQLFCSNCGYALRAEAKFCPNCGHKVE
jgi:subtilisin family serine protease/flagellar basal body-associated protein FliL